VEQERKFSKENLLKLMIELSLADGTMTKEEYLFMSRYAEQNGISPNDFAALILATENRRINFPKSEKDRMEIFYYLLFIVKSDGHVSESEENVIYHYGFKLGINEALIRDFLNVIKMHKGKYLPPELLLNQIKKYLN
jgi:uncharacterized tellurite resistance protein B-like protein